MFPNTVSQLGCIDGQTAKVPERPYFHCQLCGILTRRQRGLSVAAVTAASDSVSGIFRHANSCLSWATTPTLSAQWHIWDAWTGPGKQLSQLGGHANVISVAFSPDGSKIQFVSGSRETPIRVWDASTGKQMSQLDGSHPRCLHSVACSSDGSKIVSGSYGDNIRVSDWGGTRDRVI